MQKPKRDQNEALRHVLQKIRFLIGGLVSKGIHGKIFSRHKTGYQTHKRVKCSTVVLKRLQTQQNLASFLDFLEVMPTTFAQQGVRRDKKENFCYVQTCLFHSFPFVCALIGEPSLFRWSALFMTQPQTRRLKPSTLTHRHARDRVSLPRQPKLSWHQPCLLSEPTNADPALP